MTTDLQERFERACADEPALPPVAVRLAAGHRALQRRRAVATAVASSLAVASMSVVAVMLPGADEQVAPRAEDPAPASSSAPEPRDPTDLPVRPWPYTDQGADPMTLWTSEDGRVLYRTAADVDVLTFAETAPILDVRGGGRVIGHREEYTVRWRGRTEEWYIEKVGDRYLGMGSWPAGAHELDDDPLYYQRIRGGYEIFSDPVGITDDGRLEPRPGAVVSNRAAAGVYDEERFAGPPEVGEVSYLGTRYYALVGYQPDEHDVIVVEVAPAGRTLTEWVRDVEARMRAGEEIG